ncbi:MAG: Peptidoglycan D,D-transpeptidase FtsI [Verrucomicrobia subdivision 3 bacterium]|nr:Peptidoglycan D,D-transpeptidase FtsI [Limisphaerales bacterium]MCS1412380.1 Peptidoglycan D,D-transpeptidase FtsI [Limisphaerales bacterium]
MVFRVQLRRLIAFGILLLMGFSLLLGRLVFIQIFRHDELRAKASKHTQRTYVKQTKRGDIYDRNGALLASTQRLRILCADPSRIGRHYRSLGALLAEHLKVDPKSLIDRLRPRGFTNSVGEVVIDPHVRLRVKVTEAEWQSIQSLMKEVTLAEEALLPEDEKEFLEGLRRWAIFTEPVESHRRYYLNGELAAHVLGFVQTQERLVRNQSVFFVSGKAGVEATFDHHLQGVLGWRTTATDSRRRELVAFRGMDVDARAGFNVHLTIDAGVQMIVEDELKKGVAAFDPLTATVIVARPHTGEILALANYPTFDPNHSGDYPVRNRRNRAISDQFEPGSTFKIVSVSAALNEKVVNLGSCFDCENGHIYFMGWSLHDAHRYDILTVKEIIMKSSNIGTFKIAQQLGKERLYDYLLRFGIGSVTGISLPAERQGKLRLLEDWSGLSISRVPIGYEIAVTPLQITMAMCTIANGGWLMSPMIVRHLSDDRGNVVMTYHPEKIRRVVSEQTTRQMTEALEMVVMKGGTAPKAKLDHYTVAGKTGTARKYIPNVGYARRKCYASFIGFLPVERPEIVISVIFNEPKGSISGGVISGPVFKAIATRLANYLNIPPSNELKYQTEIQDDLVTEAHARR